MGSSVGGPKFSAEYFSNFVASESSGSSASYSKLKELTMIEGTIWYPTDVPGVGSGEDSWS